MLAYFLRRLVGTIPTMLLVTLTVFIILRLTPGGPAVAMLGEQATPEAVAALEHKLGLDRPLYIQYLRLARPRAAGRSRALRLRQPARHRTDRAADHADGGAGLPRDGRSSLLDRDRGRRDRGDATQYAASMPPVRSSPSSASRRRPSGWRSSSCSSSRSSSRWLPALGYVSPFKDPATNLKQMILPSITLGVTLAAVIARITRGAMLDALYQDYVRTARAKGLRERHVVMRHALANALIPIVTVVGLQLAGLLGGAVIIETIFALPGNGQFLVTAIFSRDFPVVQGIVVVIALAFILINLAVDLLYA